MVTAVLIIFALLGVLGLLLWLEEKHPPPPMRSRKYDNNNK